MGEIKFQNGPLLLSVSDRNYAVRFVSFLGVPENALRANAFLPHYCGKCYRLSKNGISYSEDYRNGKTDLPFSLYRPSDELYYSYDGAKGVVFFNLPGYDFVFHGQAMDLFQKVADLDHVKAMTKDMKEEGVEHFYISVTKTADKNYHVTVGKKKETADTERDIHAENMQEFLKNLKALVRSLLKLPERIFSKTR